MFRGLKAVSTGLGKVNGAAGQAALHISGLFLLAMLCIVVMQIVSRYVLNDSLSWTEEASKTLMVWTAFLVAPWAYRNGANVSIDLFVDAMGTRVAQTLHVFLSVLVLWIVAVFFFESLSFVERGMQSQSASLPLRTGYLYIVVPVSLFFLFLSGLEVLLRHIIGVFDPTDPDGFIGHRYLAGE